MPLDRSLTLAEFARIYPSAVPFEKLALLNQAQASTRFTRGELVKRVVVGAQLTALPQSPAPAAQAQRAPIPAEAQRATPPVRPPVRVVIPDSAYLTVGTTAPATIIVNGERVSSNPVVDYRVPAGIVRLRFEVTDTTGTWAQDATLTLSSNERRNVGRIPLVRPTPRPAIEVGYLTLGTQPLATIFVNGEKVTSNPLVNHAVPAGQIRLRFEVTDSTGTWAQETTVTVSPGERLNLGRITLIRREKEPHDVFQKLSRAPGNDTDVPRELRSRPGDPVH